MTGRAASVCHEESSKDVRGPWAVKETSLLRIEVGGRALENPRRHSGPALLERSRVGQLVIVISVDPAQQSRRRVLQDVQS